MKIVHHLGIDIDKLELEAHLIVRGGAHRRATFSNDEQGIADLLEWLGAQRKGCRAILEATSRYHRDVERALGSAGVVADLVNPRQARHLARGLGVIDKDDRVDARCLARAAQVLAMSAEGKRSIPAEDLRDESRAIAQLSRVAAELKKSLQGLAPDSPAAVLLCQNIAELKRRIREAEKEWTRRLESEPEIRRRYLLARSVPNVGHKTARVVAVELPADLERCTPRKAAAYAGVVPRRMRSGTVQLPDRICQGNARLRTGLFMAAMLSVYRGGQHSAFFHSLLSRGKSYKQAMVAVIHKLLLTLVSVIRRNEPWTEIPPLLQAKQRRRAFGVDMG